MDFTLSPEIESLRGRTRAFIEEHMLPLDAAPANFSEHETFRSTGLRRSSSTARAAQLVDGASEVHKLVPVSFMRKEGSDFWNWSADNRV